LISCFFALNVLRKRYSDKSYFDHSFRSFLETPILFFNLDNVKIILEFYLDHLKISRSTFSRHPMKKVISSLFNIFRCQLFLDNLFNGYANEKGLITRKHLGRGYDGARFIAQIDSLV